MKRILLLLVILLLVFGCYREESTTSLQIEAAIDTTTARIGDVLHLHIQASGSGERVVMFPDIGETSSMEVRNKNILSKGNKQYAVDFEIVFWDTGKFSIPQYPVEILKADSTKDIIFETDSIAIKIVSSVSGSGNTNLKPIKDPVPIRTPIDWRILSLAVILLFLFMLLLRLWRQRIKPKRMQITEDSDYPSALTIAIMKLNDIEKLLSKSDKEFYLQLSFIIREFLENSFYVRALEMTTSEIHQYSNLFSVNNNDIEKLLVLLGRADLAKYAKFEFSIVNRKTDLKWTSKFIYNTVD